MFKKTIGIFLLFLMILSGVVYPMRAYAVLGIIDISIDIPTIIKWIMNTLLKTILETLKHRLLTTITNQIITWIQGGGDPVFVTDFGSVAEDAFQAAVGDTIIELGYGDLCYSPLRFELEMKMTQPVFRERISCTLDDVVRNITAFKENFEKGGWIAYQEVIKPQNNPAGITFLAQQEFLRRKSETTSAGQYEANVGSGFLGDKKCTKWRATDNIGAVASSDLTSMNYQYPQGSTIGVGDPNWNDDYYKQTPQGEQYSGKSALPGSGLWQCVEDQTVTPGELAGNAVAKAFGADIDSIITADDISQHIGAIVNAAINRLTKETVNGLARLVTTKSDEGSCEDLQDPSDRAACYKAMDVKKTQKSKQSSVGSKLNKHNDTKGFNDNTDSSYTPSTSEDVPTTLETTKNILLSDLNNFSQDGKNISETLTLLESSLNTLKIKNNNTIEDIEGEDGLLQCWEDQITQAQETEESESVVAGLERNKEDAVNILSEAKEDQSLINYYLNTVQGYEGKENQLNSDIESAYNYDINNVTSTLSGEETFKLDAVSIDLYNFTSDISEDIPDTISDIETRVNERASLVEGELYQCRN